MARNTKARQPAPEDKLIGSRVRMRRRVLGLTQSALADAIGVATQQVQKYEKGTNRISVGRLHKTATFLKVSVSFFFEDSSDPAYTKQSVPSTQGDVFDLLTPSNDVRLVKAYRRIKGRDARKAFLDLLEKMADG